MGWNEFEEEFNIAVASERINAISNTDLVLHGLYDNQLAFKLSTIDFWLAEFNLNKETECLNQHWFESIRKPKPLLKHGELITMSSDRTAVLDFKLRTNMWLNGKRNKRWKRQLFNSQNCPVIGCRSQTLPALIPAASI